MVSNIIYCYSGSGNCLDIAKNIAARLGNTDIVMMRSKPEITDATAAKRVGFVFPCYGGGLPGDVEKFLPMIKVSPTAYTFGVVSYAGYPGVGLSRLNSIIPLNYWAGISHHCSCIWLFPHKLMMPPLDVEQAQNRSEQLAKKIAEDVFYIKHLDGKPRSNPVNALESSVFPKINALKTAKLTVSHVCVACGDCVKLCPRGNIHIENAIAVHGKSCIGCLSCVQYCPVEAVDVGKASKGRERYHNVNISAKELSQKLIHIG